MKAYALYQVREHKGFIEEYLEATKEANATNLELLKKEADDIYSRLSSYDKKRNTVEIRLIDLGDLDFDELAKAVEGAENYNVIYSSAEDELETKNIYLLSVCQKLIRLEDYRNDWSEKESEIKEVFCGDSWIETLGDTLQDLGDDFLNQIKEQGKTMDNIEQSELVNLIEKFDLKNKILTRPFDSKEKAESELHEIMKKAGEGYENYTLVESSSDFDRFVHNDFLDVIFNEIKFEPYRGYWNLIRCYDATNRYIGSISDSKSWDIWFNKIKKLNAETFKEVTSMIEEPGPCLGD